MIWLRPASATQMRLRLSIASPVGRWRLSCSPNEPRYALPDSALSKTAMRWRPASSTNTRPPLSVVMAVGWVTWSWPKVPSTVKVCAEAVAGSANSAQKSAAMKSCRGVPLMTPVSPPTPPRRGGCAARDYLRVSVRVRRRITAQRVGGRRALVDLALLVQQRVEGVAVEELRLLEARRELLADRAALVARVALHARARVAGVPAVEALDRPERDRAVVGVRGDVRVAADPLRHLGREAEAAAVDDAELRQHVSARLAGYPVVQRKGAVDEEVRHHVLVEVQERQDRVELRQEDVQRVHYRARAAEEARGLRQRARRLADDRLQVHEQRLKVRRQGAQVAHRRAEVVRHRLERAHERLGVLGEALEAVGGDTRLVQEDGEDLERVGQRLILGRRRREGALGVHDELAKLALTLIERAEHHAGVLHELPDRHVLLVEHLQQRRAVAREVGEVAERVVEVLGRRALHLQAGLLHPVAERRLRLRVEDAQDLVELDRRLHLGVRQDRVVGQRPGRGMPRRQLDEGLAQQCLLAQDRARVLRQRRVAMVDVEQHAGAVAALVEVL